MLKSYAFIIPVFILFFLKFYHGLLESISKTRNKNSNFFLSLSIKKPEHMIMLNLPFSFLQGQYISWNP